MIGIFSYHFFFYLKIRIEFAERRCSDEGKWEGKPGQLASSRGWTNYTPCYYPEILELLNRLGKDGEVSDDNNNIESIK